jgi:hypothetical protein
MCSPRCIELLKEAVNEPCQVTLLAGGQAPLLVGRLVQMRDWQPVIKCAGVVDRLTGIGICVHVPSRMLTFETAVHEPLSATEWLLRPPYWLTAPEVRLSPRLPVDLPLRFAREGEPLWYSGTAVDLSLTGLRFLAAAGVGMGDRLHLRLATSVAPTPLLLRAQCVRSELQGNQASVAVTFMDLSLQAETYLAECIRRDSATKSNGALEGRSHGD